MTRAEATSVSRKAAKRMALLREIARRAPWSRIRRQIDPRSDLVIWLHHRYPASWPEWVLREDTVLKDIALLNAIAETGRPFRIVSGPAVGDIANSTIVYSIDAFNPARVRNYSASLVTALRQLEAQGNTLYPTSAEAEWWENKVFMHRRFDELGINTPPTVIVERQTELDEHSLVYPLLVKDPHSSGSRGLQKVDSADDLRAIRTRFAADGRYDLIVQSILDMRRDLRCTIIGEEIVHHYFRINESGEWRPTSTRRGSRVDFTTFPERWRAAILEAFAKTGVRSGAFDICWEHDDLDTEPYFLEISPAYTPNPPPPPSFNGGPYADFKERLTGPDCYPAAFADLVFGLQRKVVAAWGLNGH
jgi:glutathione synthase/RimK-type ligase-like ATP-grasp enzyme